jgi:hypothetical protein
MGESFPDSSLILFYYERVPLFGGISNTVCQNVVREEAFSRKFVKHESRFLPRLREPLLLSRSESIDFSTLPRISMREKQGRGIYDFTKFIK